MAQRRGSAVDPQGIRPAASLASRVGRVLTRGEIMRCVWGSEIQVFWRSIDRCVSTLRNKIESDPRHPNFIQTVRDVGYRFEDFDSVDE